MNGTRTRGAWGGLVVALMLLGGCSGGAATPDASGDPSQTTTAEEPDSPPEVSAQDIAQASTAAEDLPVLGTARGDVSLGGGRTGSVVVEVRSVDASPDRTVVRFSLAAGDGGEISLHPSSLSGEQWSFDYLEGFAVVDPETRQRLLSFRESGREAGESALQTCSLKPKSLSVEEFPQTCILPALDPATKSVTIEVPRLPAIEDVPVTWHQEEE